MGLPTLHRSFRASSPVALAIAALALAVAAGLGFLVAWGAKPRPQTDLRAETILVEIRRIAKLATVEAREAQIVRIDDRVPFFYLFESRKTAVLLVRGRVLAGVNLENARIDLDQSAQRIEVELPRAEILAVEPEVEFFSEENGLVNPITPEDRSGWLRLASSELRRAALRHGLRERAAENARGLIRGLAAGLGYTVRFTGAGAAEGEAEAVTATPGAR